MLYLVAPLQHFAVGNIRNSRLTCLSALGSGYWINKVPIKCPEQGFQYDATTMYKVDAKLRPPVITAHICQRVGNEYSA